MTEPKKSKTPSAADAEQAKGSAAQKKGGKDASKGKVETSSTPPKAEATTTPTAPPGFPKLPPAPQPAPPQRPAAPQPPPFPQQRQPSNLFGGARPNSRVTWEILPTADALVRVDLSHLQYPIFSLIGLQPPPADGIPADDRHAAHWEAAFSGNTAAIAQIISDHLDDSPNAEDALKRQLDAAWAALHFTGAALMFAWREEAKVAFTTRFQAMSERPIALRPTDPLLVLNLLSRVRSGALIGNMPAALEKPFLERHLFTEDARIIAMVRASAYVEESLVAETAEEILAEEN